MTYLTMREPYPESEDDDITQGLVGVFSFLNPARPFNMNYTMLQLLQNSDSRRQSRMILRENNFTDNCSTYFARDKRRELLVKQCIIRDIEDELMDYDYIVPTNKSQFPIHFRHYQHLVLDGVLLDSTVIIKYGVRRLKKLRSWVFRRTRPTKTNETLDACFTLTISRIGGTKLAEHATHRRRVRNPNAGSYIALEAWRRLVIVEEEDAHVFIANGAHACVAHPLQDFDDSWD
jgi:hypothetical protein